MKATVKIFAVTLFVFFLYVQSVKAAPITFDVSRDADLHVTTISNDAGSSTSLEFWARTGPLANVHLWLAPGNSVTVDQDGDISGPYLQSGTPCKNKRIQGPGKTIGNESVINVAIDVYLIPADPLRPNPIKLYPGDEVTVPPGSTAVVDWWWWAKPTGLDCSITGLSESGEIIADSAAWPGPSNQSRWEVVSGSIRSQDDTADFSSIFTAEAATGCPEPASMCLLALGGLALIRRRRQA